MVAPALPTMAAAGVAGSACPPCLQGEEEFLAPARCGSTGDSEVTCADWVLNKPARFAKNLEGCVGSWAALPPAARACMVPTVAGSKCERRKDVNSFSPTSQSECAPGGLPVVGGAVVVLL